MGRGDEPELTLLKSRVAFAALQSLPGILALLVWQGAAQADPHRDFLVGSPAGVLREARGLVSDGRLPLDIGTTAIEALLGFVLGTAFGTAVGLVLWLSRTAYGVAKPYLIGLGSVPVFALGPVLIFWFGTGMWSKVALASLATFVVAIVQAYTGAQEADPNLLTLIRAFGGSRTREFVLVVIPSAAIWVLAGARLGIGMALLGAFVGEFLSSRHGLGNLIVVAEGLYNVNQIWVGVAGIVLLALAFYGATIPIESWVRRRRYQAGL